MDKITVIESAIQTASGKKLWAVMEGFTVRVDQIQTKKGAQEIAKKLGELLK